MPNVALQTVALAGNTNNQWKTVTIRGLFNQLVAFSRAPASHTGDALEAVLATISIPANSLTVNGRLKLTMLWRFTGTAGIKTTKVRLTNVSGTSLVSSANAANQLSGIFNWQLWNLGALNANTCMDGGNTGYGTSSVDVVSPNVDTSQAWALVITAQNASAADTSILLGYDLELCDTNTA